MDDKKLRVLAAELAKGIKTEADLNQFSRMLTKLTVETALNAELTDHLGYEKNAPKSGTNTRNGYSSKTLLCDDGAKGYLPGNPVGIEKMEYADPELAAGGEPLYYRVR